MPDLLNISKALFLLVQVGRSVNYNALAGHTYDGDAYDGDAHVGNDRFYSRFLCANCCVAAVRLC